MSNTSESIEIVGRAALRGLRQFARPRAINVVRMDGETPGNPENPNASRGQIIELDGRFAGELGGILRRAYDGTDNAAIARLLDRWPGGG